MDVSRAFTGLVIVTEILTVRIIGLYQCILFKTRLLYGSETWVVSMELFQ